MTTHLLRPSIACGLLAVTALFCTSNAAGQSRTPPATPTNLQAALDGQGRVNLTWIDSANDELGFRIIRERQLIAASWGDAAGFTVAANITSYIDSPSPGVYRYRVRAYNQRGNSSYTARVPITVTSLSQIPITPTNLSVQDAGGGHAQLTWTDASNNETGFEIERQPSFPSTPQTAAANATTFSDPTPGGKFAYRVRAVSAAGDSGFTPWIKVYIQPPSGNPPPGVLQAIIPGSGFPGSMSQPPAVGSPSDFGYDAKPMARWDVVPFQTFTSDFAIGVVAFHINGIDHVDFSANGGPWLSVPDMQVNPQTSVREYAAWLRAGDFSDGTVEIRAVVWPHVGMPRVLAGQVQVATVTSGEHSMFLNANGRGTLTKAPLYADAAHGSDSTGNGTSGNPYATIGKAAGALQNRDGSVNNAFVYLKAGNYDWCGSSYVSPSPSNTTGWLTIQPAPGVGTAAVIATSSNANRLSTHLVRFSGVAMTQFPAKLDTNSPMIWYDACTVSGGGTADGSSGFCAWAGGGFATNCTLSNTQNGFRGGFSLSRNNAVSNIGEDSFSDSYCVINCTSSNVTAAPGAHADVIQNQSGTFNTIWYGVIADSGFSSVQGLSSGGNTDMALVGCRIATDGNQFYMDARQGPVLQNFLMSNCVFSGTGGGFTWSGPSGYLPREVCVDVVVENSWRNLSRTIPLSQVMGPYPGVTYR